ncbi:uncharacterized protein LODBEIA_P37320 [Lodderomyces beijingensis]|uniref:Protein BIG1 n=1 Tax=Lodderomyces beijingensis TaxID=1775926 RepID=A0ABP0ZMY8_9ASCO
MFHQAVLSLGLLVTAVAAFSNTGSIIVKTNELDYAPKHFERAETVHQVLVETFQNEPVDIFYVKAEKWNPDNVKGEGLTIFPNVAYNNSKHVKALAQELNSNVAEDFGAQDIADLEATTSKNFVVVVVPSFKTPSIKDKLESKLINLYNNEAAVHVTKRETTGEEEEDSSVKLQQEIENDFAKAKSLASEEDAKNDNPVTILGADVPDSGVTTTKPNNLFTNYQFFTPGIWSGIIVGGLLLFILYNAIDWLSSLEITYASFDKQLDFNKKNE